MNGPLPVQLLLGILICVGTSERAQAEDVYLESDQFIEECFETEPEKKVLWLNKEVKASLAEILGHGYKGLRIRYWASGERTAWILEEVGKVKPITAGFVVDDGVLQRMEVLVYRESHGWEVRYPFFTKQFRGLKLGNLKRLSDEIDGISGATLSVNALIRLSALALTLHEEAMK